jgi:ribosome biogenesis GTPase / thiamine phosphate phosphatase
MDNKKEYEEDFLETKKEQKAARKIASRKDRSKYKKTNAEKREKRLMEAAQKKLSKKELTPGRVLAISPEGISVEHHGEIYLCSLRGALKQELTRAKNLVTVGDCVLFEIEKDREGCIARIEERRSVLSRQEHLRRRQEQLIAANIDQVLITVSVVSPPLKPSLVDRYIIATYKGRMAPVILINKIDLLESNTSEKELFDLFVTTYRELKIPVIPLSAHTKEGLELLKNQMKNKASVFSGQSGTGKSSLINAMLGSHLPVGDVVEKTKKGSHTTTAAHLIPLSFGGFCIDTPGIRSFGVWDLKKEDLNAYFPEIKEISHHCKYPNCTHSHEPGCALAKAVNGGKVSPLRVDSYLKLLEEIS